MRVDSKENTKICIYCKTWASGGIESFLYNVLLHMDIEGMDIDIVVTQKEKSIFTEELESLGIRVVELSGEHHTLFGGMVGLWKQLRAKKYDVIHVNAFQSLQMGVLFLAKKAGVTVRIAHSHNTGLRKSRIYLLKKAAHCLGKRIFSRYATDFWACSAAAAIFMFSEHEMRKKSFRWIPNGIDLERFRFNEEIREKIRENLQLENCLVIGNVGRLCYQKNQAFLLEVCAELLKMGQNCKLLLVGDGEERPLLEQQAQKMEISDAVIFYGVSDRAEELYWAMDVFAFPSRFEGLGIVAIEAQTAGLPVICSYKIPTEANVTSLFKQMPEKANVHDWAMALLEMAGIPERNQSNVRVVMERGYDIKDVSQVVKERYLEKEENCGN